MLVVLSFKKNQIFTLMNGVPLFDLREVILGCILNASKLLE